MRTWTVREWWCNTEIVRIPAVGYGSNWTCITHHHLWFLSDNFVIHWLIIPSSRICQLLRPLTTMSWSIRVDVVCIGGFLQNRMEEVTLPIGGYNNLPVYDAIMSWEDTNYRLVADETEQLQFVITGTVVSHWMALALRTGSCKEVFDKCGFDGVSLHHMEVQDAWMNYCGQYMLERSVWAKSTVLFVAMLARRSMWLRYWAWPVTAITRCMVEQISGIRINRIIACRI